MSAFDPLQTLGRRAYLPPMGFNTLFLVFVAGLFLLALRDAVRFARDERKSGKARRDILLGSAFFVALLNFFAFLLIAVLLGGDALNGRVQDGHYYLGSHGRYTEVSHGVFLYSAFHASLALLGVFGVVVEGLLRRRRA